MLPALYVPSWLLTIFASEFPAPFSARLIDAILVCGWERPLMRMAATFMQYLEPRLLKLQNMEDILFAIKVRV